MSADGKLKVVIGKKFDDRYLDMISMNFPDVNIKCVETEEQQEKEMVDADVLFTRILPKDTSISPRLRWIQFMWEGVDLMSKNLKGSEVLLTNAKGIHSRQMAEHVFNYLLMLARRSRQYERNQRDHFWLPWPDQPKLDTISSSTIGIIGYGKIGEAVARIARGFDMRILVVKRDPHSLNPDTPVPDLVCGNDEMERVLSESDHIVVTLPHTKETEGLIGSDQFRTMKRTAYFINVGRGRVVDEDSLVNALERGEISGAGLDVFEEEPLPPESPLWNMENVIITPHSSVGGDPADRDIVDLFIRNLRKFLEGDELDNIIDKERGY